MRKPILMVVLVVVAVACGTGADMMGEILDAGVPDAGAQGSDGVEIVCDQVWTEVREQFDYLKDESGSSIRDPDGNLQRGELSSTTTTERRYAWVTVGDPKAAIVTRCGQFKGPGPCEPDYPGNSWQLETTCNDKPADTECTTGQGGQFTGDRIYIECLATYTTVFNRAWSDYDPTQHQDSETQYGWETTTIAGTAVTP